MCRVLVIDDEEDVLKALRRRLERNQCTAATANSADEGIQLIQTNELPYDVIVTDMSMELPLDGLRVLDAAFARDLFAQVIVMTAYGTVQNAVEAMQKGAFDYIEKNSPEVDAYEMLTIKVNQALERRRRDLNTLRIYQKTSALR